MKEKRTSQHKPLKDCTNWAKLKSMTEREVLESAKSDPDAQPPTASQLRRFKKVEAVKEIDVKKIRNRLHLSQEQFAEYFGVSIRTIQEWEQHRRKPTATARNFLTVIAREPEAVQRALMFDDKNAA